MQQRNFVEGINHAKSILTELDAKQTKKLGIPHPDAMNTWFEEKAERFKSNYMPVLIRIGILKISENTKI